MLNNQCCLFVRDMVSLLEVSLFNQTINQSRWKVLVMDDSIESPAVASVFDCSQQWLSDTQHVFVFVFVFDCIKQCLSDTQPVLVFVFVFVFDCS